MCVNALSRVNDEETPQSAPRGARMVLKGCSDNEAVRSREDGLVSTLMFINNRYHVPSVVTFAFACTILDVHLNVAFGEGTLPLFRGNGWRTLSIMYMPQPWPNETQPTNVG